VVKAPRTTKGKLILILLLAIALRISAAIYLGNEVTDLPGTADQVSYHNLALRVLDGHGFNFGEAWWPVTAAGEPTAHWSYLYTLYLVAVYNIFGPNPLVARLIQAIAVGLLQPYLAYHLTIQIRDSGFFIGRRADRGDHVALLAAGLTAIYVYFVYYAATLMTEPFYITGVLASLVLTIALAARPASAHYRKLALAWGVAMGLTVLLRQLFLLLIPFFILWVIATTYARHSRKRILSTIGIAIAVVGLLILPFTAFNYTRFNRFVLLNTNAGYAFFWANHPIYGTKFRPASEMGTTYQALIPSELRQLDEAVLDQELLQRGLQFVRDEPMRYLLLSLSRIPAYFKFWPDPSSSLVSNLSRISSFALFLPFMLYGLLRSFIDAARVTDEASSTRRGFSPYILLLYLFLLVYSGIHILSWAQIRYRLPVDAVLIIFAALAIADLSQRAVAAMQQRKVEAV
jgi:hypothetical protein